jgi:hypothetical protein
MPSHYEPTESFTLSISTSSALSGKDGKGLRPRRLALNIYVPFFRCYEVARTARAFATYPQTAQREAMTSQHVSLKYVIHCPGHRIPLKFGEIGFNRLWWRSEAVPPVACITWCTNFANKHTILIFGKRLGKAK